MTDYDDDVPLTWVPDPGEEIEVWMEAICDHFGGCEHCKGVSTTKGLGIDKDLPVFCDHWCHRKAEQV